MGIDELIGRPPDRILLAHGAGGPAMRQLIRTMLLDDDGVFPEGGAGPGAMDDGAAIPVGDRFLVIATDSHVVSPRFFPGGDIGRLSITGTVNDLAMMGAIDVVGLTCSLVVEEGFYGEELARVQRSIRATCREAGVRVVTGDTKVMGRGEVDGMILNTTGVGWADRVLPTGGLSAGDKLLVTGHIGDHGLAILALRHDLGIQGDLRSDCAPLNDLVRVLLEVGGDDVVALTDPTRGGLTAALHEMGAGSGVGVLVDESAVPVRDEVRAAADLLGIEPMHMANEGKAVIGVRASAADRVLAALRDHPLGRDAALVGEAIDEYVGRVLLDTGFGRRILAEPDGEPAPRIC